MHFELLHPADQLVMIMERIYGSGLTTTSGGNLSILDDNGDIWITPGSIDKGSLTRNDIVRVTPEGETIGIHKPSVELPFHRLVYEIRPDIKAVLHAHPPALIAFSIAHKIPDTFLIPSTRLICGDVEMAGYGLPGSIELGKKIAAVFAKGINTVMLENHGVVVGGSNLIQAFMAFETLDFCARLEIDARRIGAPTDLTGEQIEFFKNQQQGDLPEFIPLSYSSFEREARQEMCRLSRRAYSQKLFTGTQGTFSQRLSENSFIITPNAVDRRCLEAGDIVRIENGRRESGKNPCRSIALHRDIYEKHPSVNSVVVAHPPHMMAFAVTGETFDSRIIPESYMMLLNVIRLPYGSSFTTPEKTAEKITKKTPLALVENDCLIVTGSSLLHCYDRLEVAEYSAKAVIAARSVGTAVAISDDKIAEIEKTFGLG